MSLASMIAGMVGAAAGAINSAASSNKKPSSSTSSGSTSGGSSSGSSGSSNSSQSSSGTSGGTYKPLGVYNDADLQKADPQAYQQIQQYKNQYSEASKLGDKAGMDKAHSLAEQIRETYGYSGGGDGSQKLDFSQSGNTAQVIAGMMDAADKRDQQYQQQLDNINAQYQAALGQMQSNIDAQKQDAAKQTALNNAAAEQAYMQTIKPNGSLAENLAANGLLSSGVTESSQIQAGNTYQNALNNNATTQTELIAELERMAAQAQYTNDLERLQAIQSVMTQIAENGYANAQDIAALRQWGIETNQNYTYQQQQLALQKQQLEQQQKELDQQLALGKLTQQQYQLQNQQLQQEIAYNAWQMKQAGVS